VEFFSPYFLNKGSGKMHMGTEQIILKFNLQEFNEEVLL